MKKGAKKPTEKYVTEKTFEKSMNSIAKSFEHINATLERHEEVLQNILKEIKIIHEDHKDFRSSITNLYSENLLRDRKIENLIARVERLETKIK